MIALNDVSKSFDGGATWAVRDLTLEVARGETLAQMTDVQEVEASIGQDHRLPLRPMIGQQSDEQQVEQAITKFRRFATVLDGALDGATIPGLYTPTSASAQPVSPCPLDLDALPAPDLSRVDALTPEVGRFWRSDGAEHGLYVILAGRVRLLDRAGDLVAKVPTVSTRKERRGDTEIWDSHWLLLLATALLGFEWHMRKQLKLV